MAASDAGALLAAGAAAEAPNRKEPLGAAKPVEAKGAGSGGRPGSEAGTGWAGTSSTAVKGLMAAAAEAATGEMDMLLSMLCPDTPCGAQLIFSSLPQGLQHLPSMSTQPLLSCDMAIQHRAQMASRPLLHNSLTQLSC